MSVRACVLASPAFERIARPKHRGAVDLLDGELEPGQARPGRRISARSRSEANRWAANVEVVGDQRLEEPPGVAGSVEHQGARGLHQ